MRIPSTGLRTTAIYFWLILFCLAPGIAVANAWPEDTIGGGFGVAANPEQLDDAALTKIETAGFSFIRYDMRWAAVEHTRGEYDWASFDTFVAALRKHHLKSMPILQAGNPVYTAKVRVPPREAFGLEWTDPAPVGEKNVRAFASFAAAAVKHFGTDDMIWEIWNEPDILPFWPPKPNAGEFLTLATATCRAMRATDPHAVIIGPAFGELPRIYNLYKTDFLNQLLLSPLMGCLDAFSVHPYRHGDEIPETAQKDYDNLRERMTRFFPAGTKPLPIVSSEWGYSLAEVTPEQQAGYALRSLLAGAMSGVHLSTWYQWRDGFSDTTPDQKDREAHFGLQSFDGSDKPSLQVLQHILPHLRDARIEKRIDLGDDKIYILSLKHADGAHSILFWQSDENAPAKTIQFSDGPDVKSFSVEPIPTLICATTRLSLALANGVANNQSGTYIPCSH